MSINATPSNEKINWEERLSGLRGLLNIKTRSRRDRYDTLAKSTSVELSIDDKDIPRLKKFLSELVDEILSDCDPKNRDEKIAEILNEIGIFISIKMNTTGFFISSITNFDDIFKPLVEEIMTADDPYEWEADLEKIPDLLKGARLVEERPATKEQIPVYNIDSDNQQNDMKLDDLIQEMVAKVDFTGDDPYEEIFELELRLTQNILKELGHDGHAIIPDILEIIKYGLIKELRKTKGKDSIGSTQRAIGKKIDEISD